MSGEVAVIGLGRSGVAVTRLLRRQGREVYASDIGASAALAAVATELAGLGAVVETGSHDLARIGRAQLCVVSPGVPPGAPPIAAARDAGVPIRAEVDLGLEALPGVRCIAVTGTNGKSTTTALIAHLLRAGGKSAEAVGNIGTPVSEIALLAVPPEWLAVELSSFQLHDMTALRPAVSVLTNLAPDHLDRYASLDDYYADKRRIFHPADQQSISVVNRDNPASCALVHGVPGRQLHFSVTQAADGWYDRGADVLRIGEEALLPRRELSLLGDHNVANALAAALAVHAAAVPLNRIADGLQNFTALAHRMEPVCELDGVLWINDSKATNVAATLVAVAALTRPFVLLLGGRHKGEPYTRLAPLLAGRCREVVAYGEARPIVVQDLSSAGRVPAEAQSFDSAVQMARELARPGDVVLLSPACSSYDGFNNFEERGRRFREIVESW